MSVYHWTPEKWPYSDLHGDFWAINDIRTTGEIWIGLRISSSVLMLMFWFEGSMLCYGEECAYLQGVYPEVFRNAIHHVSMWFSDGLGKAFA